MFKKILKNLSGFSVIQNMYLSFKKDLMQIWKLLLDYKVAAKEIKADVNHMRNSGDLSPEFTFQEILCRSGYSENDIDFLLKKNRLFYISYLFAAIFIAIIAVLLKNPFVLILVFFLSFLSVSTYYRFTILKNREYKSFKKWLMS